MRLIKLGAEWCGPCKTMDTRLKNFTECEVKTYDVESEDVETENLVEKYKVRNIPVIVLEDDNGDLLHKWVGAVSLTEIEEEVKKHK
jgi:thioredoxin-like negative regulator of GroEL